MEFSLLVGFFKLIMLSMLLPCAWVGLKVVNYRDNVFNVSHKVSIQE